MRGVSLPINTVIIIGLAILVLVVVGYFFTTGINPLGQTKLENALTKGCKIYMESGQSPSTISVGDVNNDGNDDNLTSVCRIYYGNSSMTDADCGEKCRERFGSE